MALLRSSPAIGSSTPSARPSLARLTGARAPSTREPGAWNAPVAAGSVVCILALIGIDRRSFWLDEALSLGATHSLVSTWRSTGGTMGLYYALLTPWSAGGDDRAWLRLLSVVFVVGAVVVAWAAFQRLSGPRVAAVAAGVTSLSWMVVHYAQEARSYGLVMFLSSVGWLALVAAVQESDPDRRRRWWALYVGATLLSPLAHGLTILQFLAQVGVLWLAPDRRAWFARLQPVVIALTAEVSLLFILGASNVASWIPPLDRAQVMDLIHAFTGPSLAAVVVLGAATMAGAVITLQRRAAATDPLERWLATVPVAWALMPPMLLLVTSAVRPYLLARYVAASAPGVALLIGLAVVGGPGRSWLRMAAVGLPVLLVLSAGQVALHRGHGDDWSGAANTVASAVRGGDGIVFPDPFVRVAFDAAWAGQDRAETPVPISPIQPIGQVRRAYVIVDHAAVAVADSDLDRVWVLDQERPGDSELAAFIYDPAMRGFRPVLRKQFDGGIRLVLLQRD